MQYVVIFAAVDRHLSQSEDVYRLYNNDQLLTKYFTIKENGSFLNVNMGAQWLGGRVLDSRRKGCVFEPHPRHCVVSLSKTH